MTGFHSASTIRVHPYTLKLGFMLLVVFSPRVSVRRICVASRMPFAASVANTARNISSFVCTFLKARALADAKSLCTCCSN